MEQQQFKMGLPLRDNNGGLSYIVETSTPAHKMSMFGANGMQDIHFQVHTVNDDGDTVTLNDFEAVEEFNNAAKRQDGERSAGQMFDLVTAAEAKKQAAKAARIAAMEQSERNRTEYQESIRDKVPSDAKAVIIAELHKDESDLMSDYHGYSVTETIVLGFSTHTRDLFPEMRKAACNAPETAHLYNADASHEHREKYSMGDGYYLGQSKYRNGWVISKRRIQDYKGIPIGARFELGTPDKVAPAAAATVQTQEYSLHEWLHTKKQTTIYIIELHTRVERDQFTFLRDSAKANGGWYSRKFGQSPAGFAFETREDAHNWAQNQFSNESDPGGAAQLTDEQLADDALATFQTAPKPSGKLPEKLRAMADKLQSDIDNKRGDRQENTAKRQAEAQHARTEADRLERTQQAMRAIANMIEQGTLPANLTQFKSKKSIYDAMSAKRGGMVQNGYHSYNTYENEPSDALDDDQKQLWTLLGEKDPEIIAAEKLKACLNTVKGAKIAGYFATTDTVLNRVMEEARIEPHHNVLEPTAGDGAMIRRIAPLITTGMVNGYEINHSLHDVCEQQGLIVDLQDFMQVDPRPIYHRVVMNPPFERLQDCEMVRHAFKFLKPEGILVAVMSPSFEFNSAKKAQNFRDWLRDSDDIDHYNVQTVEAGAFKESGTNIATLIVTIQRV